MLEAILGTILLAICIGIYCYAQLPTKRGTERQRQDALARYARDVDAD